MNELRIDLYNRLTDIDGITNDENFLCSIDYKPNNGNIILNALESIKQKYDFSIVKGFVGENFCIDKDYNEFKRCIVKFTDVIDIDTISDYLNGLSLKKLDEKLFEFSIYKKE